MSIQPLLGGFTAESIRSTVSVLKAHKQSIQTVDWNDGQFFVAMEWWWSYFPNDGMAMVFENFLPSPSMVFGGINHRQRWFFDGFAIFGNQWLTMVTKEKTRISRQTQIHNKLQVNLKTIKSQTQHDSKILYCQFTQLTYPYAFKFAILKHVINIFFEILFDFCLS